MASEKAQEAALKEANDDRSPPPTSKRKKTRAAPPPRAESSSPVVQKTNSRQRATSLSSASDISDAPLAQTTRVNGSANGNGEDDSPSETRAGTPPLGEKANGTSRPTPTPLQSHRNAPSSHSTQSLQSLQPAAQPPEWLLAAMEGLQEKYPTDKFEAVLRKVSTVNSPEWRIKCLDCPGKVSFQEVLPRHYAHAISQLYTPGGGETLQNYEVHLKNRHHRQRVNARLDGEPLS